MISYILLLVFGLVVLRYLVPRDYLKRGKLSPLIASLQALLFFMYGGFPIIYLPLDWPAVIVPPVIHISGVLILLVGLAVLFYCIFRLGIARSIGRGTPGLRQSGIYRASRNPQAIACGLYVIGFFMLWPSWYAVGWAMQYFVLIYIMVLTEEKHLRQIHGQKYVDYCKKVPRYLGLTSYRKVHDREI